MCIVFHGERSDELPLAEITEFTDMIQDLVLGPMGETNMKVVMRVTFSDERVHDKPLMSDSEFWKHESAFDRRREDADWSYTFRYVATLQEETETPEAI
jgi:hypothetical protein